MKRWVEAICPKGRKKYRTPLIQSIKKNSLMPKYKITGFGRDTNRKRVRLYAANSIEEAYEKAYEDGTIIDTSETEVLPDPPPPPEQLALALELGIEVPTGTTKKELSVLISQAKKMASPHQIRLCKEIGVYPPLNLTKKAMSSFIEESLKDEMRRRRYEALPPTERQLEFASEAGIRFSRHITRWELSELIDQYMEKNMGADGVEDEI